MNWYKIAQLNTTIYDILKEKYPQINFYVYENKTRLILSQIIVPKELRNQGLGSAFMKDLIDYSNKTKKPIYLTPSKDFGGKITKLRSFYRNFDFKNKPKSDYSERESLKREPDELV
jgi:predicted GNAT family acetyltransferase